MGFKIRKFFSQTDSRMNPTKSENWKTHFKDALRAGEGMASLGGTEFNREMGINYGGEKDALFGGANKFANEKAVAEEKVNQAQAAENERVLLERADASYGVGLNPEAQASASRMNARRAAAQRHVFNTGRQQADQEYATGLSTNRSQLARSGLIGSGVEGQARNDLLAQYFSNINQAQQAGQQAGRDLDTAATQNRLALRSGVRGGQITDTTGLGAEIVGLDSQGSNAGLWENSLGKFLPTAAQQYSNRRLSNAYGAR